MKQLSAIIVVFISIFLLYCAETGTTLQKEQASQKIELYTAFNIWRLRSWNMRCINYKYGNNFIPAGTKVDDVKITEDAHGNPRISFVTVDDNRKYNIYFTGRWHPGHTIEDYKNYIFTTKTFEELTAGMSGREISAIRSGTIVDGMSKEGVLATYGRPPEHRTPSLQRNIWYYWRNKFRHFEVCFDKENRTTFCK